MFGRAFKVGTLLGFRIEISFTFLLLLGVILLTSGLSSGAAGVLGGLLMVGVLFGSVLLHELGHAVVARHFGIPILGIELHFVGGAAKMAQPPRTAREEIIVALAGPGVSFGVAAGAYALSLASGASIFGLLGLINLMLGAFNLLPALPMDGGRVLRALLSERLGRLRATQVAASVAQGIAIVMVVLGIVQYVRPLLMVGGIPLSGFALIIVGFLVWIMAAQERAMAGRWRYLDEAPEAQVLDAQGRVIYGADGAETAPLYPPHPDAPGWSQIEKGGDVSRNRIRRVIRLPNGMVMVVEEYVRW